MLQAIKLLWDFSRPHTIIGSFLSITTLFAVAVGPSGWSLHWPMYIGTLVAALGCNIFITGLNQITDVAMDRINKPFLPIADGRLNESSAKRIIWTAFGVSVLAAAWTHPFILGLILGIMGIGAVYSIPPIRLKQHHLSAAFCIVLVRGVLVNLGIGAAFDVIVDGQVDHWPILVSLTLFVSVFSLVIAWFKDLYDTEGDEIFAVRTLPLVLNRVKTFQLGSLFLVLAYLGTMLFLYVYAPDQQLLFWGHGVLLGLFLLLYFRADMDTREGIYRFYMRFWVFFFGEYLLFLAAAAVVG